MIQRIRRRLWRLCQQVYCIALRAEEWLIRQVRPSRSVVIFVHRASRGAGLTIALIDMAHLLARRGYRATLLELVPSDGKPARPLGTSVRIVTLDQDRPVEEAITAALQDIGPDFIYAPGLDESILAAIKAAAANAMLIFGDHSSHRLDQATKNAFSADYLFALRAFDAVHTVNDEAAEVARIFIHKPVFSIPNPSPRFTRRTRSVFRSRTIVVPSRMHKVKRVEDTIRAFNALAGDFPEWRLDIYGRGHMRESIAALIGSMDSRKRIKLRGFSADIPGELARSAMMVLSSRSEAFGIVYVEAMASNCPIVSYGGHMGARALLRHDYNAFLAPHLNQPALAAQMRRVMTMIEKKDPFIWQVLLQAEETVERLRAERVARQWDLALRRLRRAKERAAGSPHQAPAAIAPPHI